MGVSPAGPYWNPTRAVSDSRLPALVTDTGMYTFTARADRKVSVKGTLPFPRAFAGLMEQKDWYVPDIVMGPRKFNTP